MFNSFYFLQIYQFKNFIRDQFNHINLCYLCTPIDLQLKRGNGYYYTPISASLFLHLRLA